MNPIVPGDLIIYNMVKPAGHIWLGVVFWVSAADPDQQEMLVLWDRSITYERHNVQWFVNNIRSQVIKVQPQG